MGTCKIKCYVTQTLAFYSSMWNYNCTHFSLLERKAPSRGVFVHILLCLSLFRYFQKYFYWIHKNINIFKSCQSKLWNHYCWTAFLGSESELQEHVISLVQSLSQNQDPHWPLDISSDQLLWLVNEEFDFCKQLKKKISLYLYTLIVCPSAIKWMDY